MLGGLLAGLVLNIGEFIFNDMVIGAQMKTWLAAHNFAEPSGKFVAIAVGLTFILGIVIVLTYALIRPRLGPGVKTAIVAGLISWFICYVYVGIINGVLFGLTVDMIGLAIVWGPGGIHAGCNRRSLGLQRSLIGRQREIEVWQVH